MVSIDLNPTIRIIEQLKQQRRKLNQLIMLVEDVLRNTSETGGLEEVHQILKRTLNESLENVNTYYSLTCCLEEVVTVYEECERKLADYAEEANAYDQSDAFNQQVIPGFIIQWVGR